VVILIAYGQMETAEATQFRPRVVFVDSDNRIVGTGHDPAEVLPGMDSADRLERGDTVQPVEPVGPVAGNRTTV
jgi:aspartate 1-decarboxylase